MTAAIRHLAPVAELPASGEPALGDALVETLSESELVDLLLRRFRGFLGAGHPLEEALLLAVGRSA